MYTLFKQPITLSGFINMISLLFNNCGREVVLPVEILQHAHSDMLLYRNLQQLKILLL